MKVEIWSDVRCPFCYIGKRKFETALERFPGREQVEIIWRSFQLDPTLKTQDGVNIYDYFAAAKGIPRAEAVGLFSHVTQVAKEVGLDFNLEASILANSFQAHRLIQYAKHMGFGNEVEEELFRIHFIEGKNIDDPQVLQHTGEKIGLDPAGLSEVLSTGAYADDVELDQLAAQRLGINGVPFFVFNGKYGVSGAQSPEVFLETLEKVSSEQQSSN
jgi:predicted DsbA family dithiol-disulfide isomerase